jgi:hypothetical protein
MNNNTTEVPNAKQKDENDNLVQEIAQAFKEIHSANIPHGIIASVLGRFASETTNPADIFNKVSEAIKKERKNTISDTDLIEDALNHCAPKELAAMKEAGITDINALKKAQAEQNVADSLGGAKDDKENKGLVPSISDQTKIRQPQTPADGAEPKGKSIT